MAAQMGYWTASFVLAGLFPAAVIYLGRRLGWHVVTAIGCVLAFFLVIGNYRGNGINPGGILGAGLIAYALFRRNPTA